MRRLVTVCLVALCLAPGARAAALDAARIAAIDQAAAAFLKDAADAKKTGLVPRQSDPGVAALLDTVFDTRELDHGALPYADLGALREWLSRAAAVGAVYVAANRQAHDAGLFGPETERFYAAAVALMQAIADCAAAERQAHPGEPVPRAETELRTAIAGNLDNFMISARDRGLTEDAAAGRLTILLAAAPSFARFLTPDEVARLRRTAMRLDDSLRDRKLRTLLGSLATALAAPTAAAPPASEAPASGEIALETDGGAYRLPVRINGATTVDFVLDTGASLVVLPKDVVDALTASGAVAAGDLLGPARYVTADGKRHKGTSLLLRRLDVAGRTVTNVMAIVAPAKAEALLGQSFLAKFRSWTLDNRRHVLIIGE